MRDRDIDEEFVALMKQRPNVILVSQSATTGCGDGPQLLAIPCPPPNEEAAGGGTDRPADTEAFGIQARNLAKLNAAGVRVPKVPMAAV